MNRPRRPPPHLNVKSRFLVYLTNVPPQFSRGRELKQRLIRDFGPVHFIETFEAWGERPRNNPVIVEFGVLNASEDFVSAILKEKSVVDYLRGCQAQHVAIIGPRMFFEMVFRDTDVDMLACSGQPPSEDWARRRRRTTAISRSLKPYSRYGSNNDWGEKPRGRGGRLMGRDSPSSDESVGPYPSSSLGLRRYFWEPSSDTGRRHVLTFSGRPSSVERQHRPILDEPERQGRRSLSPPASSQKQKTFSYLPAFNPFASSRLPNVLRPQNAGANNNGNDKTANEIGWNKTRSQSTGNNRAQQKMSSIPSHRARFDNQLQRKNWPSQAPQPVNKIFGSQTKWKKQKQQKKQRTMRTIRQAWDKDIVITLDDADFSNGHNQNGFGFFSAPPVAPPPTPAFQSQPRRRRTPDYELEEGEIVDDDDEEGEENGSRSLGRGNEVEEGGDRDEGGSERWGWQQNHTNNGDGGAQEELDEWDLFELVPDEGQPTANGKDKDQRRGSSGEDEELHQNLPPFSTPKGNVITVELDEDALLAPLEDENDLFPDEGELDERCLDDSFDHEEGEEEEANGQMNHDTTDSTATTPESRAAMQKIVQGTAKNQKENFDVHHEAVVKSIRRMSIDAQRAAESSAEDDAGQLVARLDTGLHGIDDFDGDDEDEVFDG